MDRRKGKARIPPAGLPTRRGGVGETPLLTSVGPDREGGEIMVCRLTKEFFFEAAHTLPHVAPDHPCHRMHGHSYRVEISVEGEIDPQMGWLYDHSQISEAMNPIVDGLDHRYLNEIEGLENPTAEMICGWLWKRLAPVCPGLCEIVIQETPRARCTYRGQ